MNKVFWMALIIVGVSSMSVPEWCLAQSKDQPSSTVEEVLQAWQQRQDRIPSARFTWKRSRSDEHRFSQVEETRQLTQEDYYECVFHADNVSLRMPGSPADVFSRIVSRFDGPNLTKNRTAALSKFKKSGAEVAPAEDHYIHQRLFHPTSVTEFWLPSVTKGFYPKAWRYEPVPSLERSASLDLWFQPAADTTGQISFMFAQAPLISIRPFSPIFGEVQAERCRLAPDTKTIAGSECLVLEETLGSPAHVRSFWVDPQRDFAILRYQGITDFRLAVQIDFEYQQNPRQGWIPKSWTAIELLSSTKTIRNFASTHDVQVEFDIPPKRLSTELTFPPGTWLVDETSQQQLLVQKSGKQELFTDVVGVVTSSASDKWSRRCESVYSQWITQQAEQANLLILGWIVLSALTVVGIIALGYFMKKQSCRYFHVREIRQ